MRNKKRVFRYFTIMDYENEGEFLREQHKQGWKFTKVSFLGIYHFVKCNAEDVIYQLDYNQDGISHKSEYVQMFEDCGWKYLLDFVGYSYFRKPVSEMKGNEEIFCDDDSRLEMMKRVFKGRMLPLIIVFFASIPQTIHQYSANGITSPLTIMQITILILCLMVFTKFVVKFKNFQGRLGK